MSFTPHGKHLIAGEWIDNSDARFQSNPASGTPHSFSEANEDHVDLAVEAAEEAFWSYSASSRHSRAAFLRAIAEQIEARGADLTEIAMQESGLPSARLEGERGRTCGQLRLFADHIEAGDYLDRRHDAALPDRAPAPRPELFMIQEPIGPVAVFGASNFPLAFSTAGGDTASALAAGCPVVVKGHPAHPGTSELVAEAIHAAIKASEIHPGVFSLIQSNTRESGEALVTHPLITAVGFTGGLAGGRALFDLCAGRDVPIPFYGELGSVNPMFLMPAALEARHGALGEGWAGSLTMGAGQFCTNPGVAVVMEGPEADAFIKAATKALDPGAAQTMLTDGIATAYRAGRDRLEATTGVRALLTSMCDLRNATPNLFVTTGADWLANEALGDEVFGPLGLVVIVESLEEMLRVARSLEGQLTCTIHMDDGDTASAQMLLPILARKAGRVLANGFPTGVEVADTMVHGGPYPASTNFGATSVGTMAIRRFLRPVCYQNMPSALLPDDLG